MGHNRAGDRVKAKKRRIRRLERKAAKAESAAKEGKGVGGLVKKAVKKVTQVFGAK
jgi:hypothetical protein